MHVLFAVVLFLHLLGMLGVRNAFYKLVGFFALYFFGFMTWYMMTHGS